jgi:enoyl-CoA hydratase/carnithine racemase
MSTDSSTDTVIYEKRAPTATIWLNRPEARNSMTKEMSVLFREAVTKACVDPEVRVIIYRGKGEDFCTGSALDDLDLDDLDAVRTSFDPGLRNGFPSIFKGVQRVENEDIPKPTVAVVQGYVAGGGFEIMCDADFVIADQDAKIGDMHMPRGLIGGAGVLGNLSRLVGVRRMRDLVFAGRVISGAEAEGWGLANRAVPAAEIEATLDQMVSRLASYSPRAMRLSKMAYSRALDADKDTLGVLETMLLLTLLGDHDSREGVDSFLAKRDPVWSEDVGDPGRVEP